MAGYNQPTAEENRKSVEKRLKTLRASYEMYENSKKEIKKVHKEKKDQYGSPVYSEDTTNDTLQLMNTMQSDIRDEYAQLGGDVKDLDDIVNKTSKKRGNDRKALEDIMKKEAMKDEMAKYIEKMNSKTENTENDSIIENNVKTSEIDNYAAHSIKEHESVRYEDKSMKNNPIQNFEMNEQQRTQKKQMYDFVKLPSKGECYRNKLSEVKVSYLTAYDENMILSPNLYKDGTFLDYLLKAKVLEDIDINDILPGDRDAIIIWLRATGYGNEYPIVVTDPESGKQFDAVVDLSKIKYKEFKLHADENGYFEYTLPLSKDVIKFRFLTNADQTFLRKLRQAASNRVNIISLRTYISSIESCIENNDMVDDTLRNDIDKLINKIYDGILTKYDETKDETFTRDLTDNLTLHTVSINGIKDRKYISDYILNMNIRDAAEYRKYLIANEPGIDYNITVERPASLGGGSIDTFLQLNQFIFVNV